MKLFMFVFLCLHFSISQDLLKPTGQYAVGTQEFEFIDLTRKNSFPPNTEMNRTILVKLWYPSTAAEGIVANFTTTSSKYREIKTHSFIRPQEIKKSTPLIIISPGRGVVKHAYTQIAEELASQGYAIVSIDMPEIGNVTYKDGYRIPGNDAYRPGKLMAGPYEKVDAFFENVVKIGTADLSFGLSKLSELANSKHIGLRYIDYSTIGVLGHSLGGRIGGAFSEENKSVNAYISMEGIPPRPIRTNGMRIVQAHLVSSGTYPYAKNNYDFILQNKTNEAFVLKLDGYGHNSILDYPTINPDSYTYKIDPKVATQTLRTIIVSFFDTYLRKSNNSEFKSLQFDGVTIQD